MARPETALVRPAAGLLVLLLLYVPPGEAAPDATVPLYSELRNEPPVHFEGLLVAGPSDARHTGHVTFPAAGTATGQRLLRSETAHFQTLEYVEGARNVPLIYEPPPPLGGPQINARLARPSLQLEGLRNVPQFLLRDWEPNPDKPLADFRARGAVCQVTVGDSDEVLVFPDDPDRASTANGLRDAADADQLTADCALANLTLERPGNLMLYGMDLLLDSPDLEQPLRIQTGTFAEEANGIPTGRRITRVLSVSDSGRPHAFDLPFDGSARFHARSFLGVGTLLLERAEGFLRWGPRTQNGTLDPFEADGEFLVARGAQRAMNVDGRTLNGPGELGGPLAGLGLDAPTWIALAAGAVAAALLVEALWLLFSKLQPGRLLDHPRRASILEHVRAHPGLPAYAVARALNLSRAIALHHVHTLRRAGHLTVHRVGGRTALFPANLGYRGRETQVAFLSRPTHARLHGLLLDRPGLDQAELARAIGVTRARVSQALADLVGAGLVEPRPLGRKVTYRAVSLAGPVPS